MFDETARLALGLIHAGMITPTEAADIFDLPPSTVHRWCKQASIDAKRQRAQYIRKWTNIAIHQEWKLPRSYLKNVRSGTRRKKEPSK